MLHVKSCRYAEDYKLALQFNNGTEGIIDLQDLPESGTVFAPLKDKKLFRKAKLEEWGVVTWLNGTLDIAPEYLFFLINKTNPEFKNLFIQWGYLQTLVMQEYQRQIKI